MHPRQANLLRLASEVSERTTPVEKRAEVKQAQTAVLWKYTDPDGKPFYLEERLMTVKSPFSGKSFTARPVKHTPAQVAKELKEGEPAAKEASWKV